MTEKTTRANPSDVPLPIMERLHAIKALAEQGIDGEKVQAIAMLTKLLKKWKLTMADLDSESVDWYRYSWKNEYESRLFWRIIGTVCGWEGTTRVIHNRNKQGCQVELTAQQQADVSVFYAYHRKAWAKAQEEFFSVYVIKNKLLNAEPIRTDGPDTPRKTRTAEDKAYGDRLLSMMKGLEDGSPRRQIEG